MDIENVSQVHNSVGYVVHTQQCGSATQQQQYGSCTQNSAGQQLHNSVCGLSTQQ